MNTLLALFNSPEWTLLVKTLLHTLWQAGGLALLLWIALRRAATPATRYRLTLGTLAAILGMTLLTWAVLKQSAPEPDAPELTSPITLTHKPSGISPAANFGEPSVIAYSTPIPKPAEETRWSGWLALAWLLGTALMLTRAGIQVAGAERLRRSCKPLDDSRITQLLAEAQRALNLTRRIRVAVTDKLTSPAVVGVIVPTLILPLTLLTTLTPEQIRFILLHELAHIRRGDYFANLFQLFIEALLFFNPAVWWISHQVRREREACCDALAIELSGAPVDYARTLLHVAETMLNPPPAAAPAFSENQSEPSSLTDRVQRLLVPGYRPALRLTWRAMLAAIVVGGTLLFLSAIGARNVVGAVSTNTTEKTTKPATNVVEKVRGKADLGTNNFTMPRWEGLWKPKLVELTNDGTTFMLWNPSDEEVLERLDQIKFERVFFQNRKLNEVLTELAKALQETDPEKKGFSLMLPADWDYPAKREGIDSIIINMPSELRRTTMRNVLESISSSADKPIQYQLGWRYAYFHMKWNEPSNLSSKRFNLYWKTFLPFIGLDESVIDRESRKNGDTNLNDKIGDAIRSRFLKEGIDLRPPNYVLYKPEPDLLYVYAPQAELDKVEALLKDIGQKSGGSSPKYAPTTNPAPTGWTIGDGTGQKTQQWFYYRLDVSGVETPITNLNADQLRIDEPNTDASGKKTGDNRTNSAGTTTRHVSGTTYELTDGNSTAQIDIGSAGSGMSAWTVDASPSRTNGQWIYYRVGTNKAGADESFPKVVDKGRKGILQRLDHIQLDNFSCDKLPLSEVLRRISERVREFDPTKEGINFSIEQATKIVSGTNALASVADIPITISSNHTIAAAGSILYYITKGAATPIEYSIEDYSVKFYLKKGAIESAEEIYQHERGWSYEQLVTVPTKTPDGEPLATRIFRTDANMMAQAFGIIPKVIGSAGLQTNNLSLTKLFPAVTNAALIVQTIHKTFKSIGVDLDLKLGKTYEYNYRSNSLSIRATEKELDLIEAYIAKNATPPPQVNIKIRWVEIPQKLMTPAWLNAASNAFFLPLVDPETRYNILTEQEMADVRHRIERRDGIELLSEGQVTTLTGRQAQIAVSEVKTIVTGFSTNKNDGSVEPEAKPVPLGPILDVLPTVTSDGASIRLEVIPTFTEFVGYDTNTAHQPAPKVVNGETNYTTIPLPIFRVKQITHDAVVPDGQTLILGNFTVSEIAKQPSGEMRTNDVTSTHTNHLFILITPTIIDPVGYRAKPAPILNR